MAFYPGDRVVTDCPTHSGSHGTVRIVTHFPNGDDGLSIDLDDGGICSGTPDLVEHEVRTPKVGDHVRTTCSVHPGACGTIASIHPNGTARIGLDGGGVCFSSVDDVTPLPPKPSFKAPALERSAILKDADALITGDRQAEYGPPSVNFQRIADLWAVLFPERQWTPGDVARAMAAVKLARTPEGFKRDTAVDLAGYAALYGELEATA